MEKKKKKRKKNVHKYIYKCTFDFALQTSVYYIFLNFLKSIVVLVLFAYIYCYLDNRKVSLI